MPQTETRASGRREPEALARAELFSQAPALAPAFWDESLGYALGVIRANIATFAAEYPAPASIGNVYPAIPNTEWTSSFWTGMLWLAYEATGEKIFRETASYQLADYRSRLDEHIEVETHDLGFLYTLSAVAQWKLTADHAAREAALKAADLLLVRYHEKAGIIQAWGDLNDSGQRGRAIIDCAMNLPLLHWASGETGNPHYAEAATRHIARANEHMIRQDWSSFHTFHFDPATGAALRGTTAQGHSDSSCWARGQAWGIYGNSLSHRYTRDKAQLEAGRGLARYFLNRLPEDLVSYWDLSFTSGGEERDSSAAAIAACGLLDLSAQLPLSDPDRRPFENAALRILESLATLYTSAADPKSNGILLHAVYSKPAKHGVDECCIWGDYFYVEALLRLTRSWAPYW
jgi:unsaturated chondroitin disaccharide hydrolase